jgi:hypothetical protein
VPDQFLSTWSRRLPRHIQTILAGQAEGNLDEASRLADRIAEVAPFRITASTADLLKIIDDLSRQVAALTSGRTRDRSHSRDKRRTNDIPSPAHDPANRRYCRYHWRFGDMARKCTPPCSFLQKENGDRR